LLSPKGIIWVWFAYYGMLNDIEALWLTIFLDLMFYINFIRVSSLSLSLYIYILVDAPTTINSLLSSHLALLN
jgi:hypothetical protein